MFPANIHSFSGVLMPRFWACTCDRVAPLTPLCCIILTHTANTGLTHCRALVIICKVQPSLSTVRIHSHTHTHTHTPKYNHNTRHTKLQQAHTIIPSDDNNATAWPYRYCGLHTLSDTDSVVSAFYLGKCDFSLPQFLSVILCIRVCGVFTHCAFICKFTLFKYNRILSCNPSQPFLWKYGKEMRNLFKFCLSSSNPVCLLIRGLCPLTVLTWLTHYSSRTEQGCSRLPVVTDQ